MRTTSKTFHNGSSPLTRGTRNAVALIVFFARFIPAYAGNSSPGIGGILAVIGSSPLTRGTRELGIWEKWFDRFIPAYAGNSVFWGFTLRYPPVHPRLRGELIPKLILMLALVGSSPLTRGTLLIRNSESFKFRFIPAYAGNSRWPWIRRISNPGSSPLTRGTHKNIVHRAFLERFIPAYAGNSVWLLFRMNRSSVHPRLRGELT